MLDLGGKMYYLCIMKTRTTTTTQVTETDMWDGKDLIHNWRSVSGAIKSGRFDYLVENGDCTYTRLKKCKSVEELVNFVGHPFYL